MVTEAQARWPGFKYEPVGAIANRLLVRYLRTQRKNMRRFFEERGMYALADRMNQIRKSRQNMMAKNRMFQKVLNDYAKLTAPATVASVPGAPLQSAQNGDVGTETDNT
jgi:hypothetical protein